MDNSTASASSGTVPEWRVADDALDFQSPRTGTDSSSGWLMQRGARQIRLEVDPRVIEGRRLMAEDEREHGAVPEEALNEVRSGWPD